MHVASDNGRRPTKKARSFIGELWLCSRPVRPRWDSARRASVAADHGPVNKVAEADRERNNTEGGNRPDIAIRLDASNQCKRGDEAASSTDQQSAGASGTRPRVHVRR